MAYSHHRKIRLVTAAVVAAGAMAAAAHQASPALGWMDCGAVPDEYPPMVIGVAQAGDGPFPASAPASCATVVELYSNLRPAWVTGADVWNDWYCFDLVGMSGGVNIACQFPPPRRNRPSQTYAVLAAPEDLVTNSVPPPRARVVGVPEYVRESATLRRARPAEARTMFRVARRFLERSRPSLPSGFASRYRAGLIASYDDLAFGTIVVGSGYQGYKIGLRRLPSQAWKAVALNPMCDEEGSLSGIGSMPESLATRLLCS